MFFSSYCSGNFPLKMHHSLRSKVLNCSMGVVRKNSSLPKIGADQVIACLFHSYETHDLLSISTLIANWASYSASKFAAAWEWQKARFCSRFSFFGYSVNDGKLCLAKFILKLFILGTSSIHSLLGSMASYTLSREKSARYCILRSTNDTKEKRRKWK